MKTVAKTFHHDSVHNSKWRLEDGSAQSTYLSQWDHGVPASLVATERSSVSTSWY